MNVDIYECVNAPKHYLSVPAGVDLKIIPGVFALGAPYDSLELSMPNIPLEPDRPRLGFNVPQIIGDIEAHGYALHHVTINVEVVGRS